MKYCPNCGKEIDEKAFVCVHCGVKQPGTGGGSALDLDLGEKNRMVAALLALLLGGIGAHKFYLGQTNTGIVYLLLLVTTISIWLSLIDGIVLLSMSDEDFTAKYG